MIRSCFDNTCLNTDTCAEYSAFRSANDELVLTEEGRFNGTDTDISLSEARSNCEHAEIALKAKLANVCLKDSEDK